MPFGHSVKHTHVTVKHLSFGQGFPSDHTKALLFCALTQLCAIDAVSSTPELTDASDFSVTFRVNADSLTYHFLTFLVCQISRKL